MLKLETSLIIHFAKSPLSMFRRSWVGTPWTAILAYASLSSIDLIGMTELMTSLCLRRKAVDKNLEAVITRLSLIDTVTSTTISFFLGILFTKASLNLSLNVREILSISVTGLAVTCRETFIGRRVGFLAAALVGTSFYPSLLLATLVNERTWGWCLGWG